MSDSEHNAQRREKLLRTKKNRVDPETLIAEVKQRPELWNFNHLDYKDKQKKKQSWDEICCKLIPVYTQMSECDRQSIAKDISSRWKGFRDAYIKDLKKCRRNGDDEMRYIHADLLTFLGLTIQDESSPLDVSLEPTVSIKLENLEWPEDDQEIQKRSLEVYNESDNDSEPLQKRMYRESQRNSKDIFTMDDSVQNANTPSTSSTLPLAYISVPEDDDMSFFKSLMPAVKDLTKRQKMSFRIQVMQVLQTFTSDTGS